MRALPVVVAMVFGASCSVSCTADRDSAATTSSAPFDAIDCPVADEAFCTTAADAANALAARDADQLLALSRAGTIICAEMAVEYFLGCTTQEVLNGYGLSGPDLLVEVATEAEYVDRLRDTTRSIDAAVNIVGVGTCGPDSPGQRTYHLSWTTALSDDGVAAAQVLGSFELTFQDEEWRIALFYLGRLEHWETEQPDPLSESFCAAGRTPWQN